MAMNASGIDRRALLTLAAGGVAFAGGAKAARSAAAGDRKLVLVILRGAMDGLAAAPPYADADYARLRGDLAIPAPGAVGGAAPLSNGFGLHPSFEFLHAAWREKTLCVLPAASSTYRERSHFDGQDVLESGGAGVFTQNDGWLNRALGATGLAGVAMAASMPLVLRGTGVATNFAPSVQPAADEDTIRRLMDLYAADGELAATFAKGVETSMTAMNLADAPKGRNSLAAWPELARALAAILAAPGGAAAGVIAFDGWDTHINQGGSTGALANRLGALDKSLAALKEGLGAAWPQTVVVVATEFGRTVRVNGTRGTDHGTGGAAFLVGGAVRGGKMLGDWPGLSNAALYEGRDVAPANDLRSLFKGVLADHWGVSSATLDQNVFPGSSGVAPFFGLLTA
jgi:uncharacterized protein (DUF1501 family)